MNLSRKQKALGIAGLTILILSPFIAFYAAPSAALLYCDFPKPDECMYGLFDLWFVGFIIFAAIAAVGCTLIALMLSIKQNTAKPQPKKTPRKR